MGSDPGRIQAVNRRNFLKAVAANAALASLIGDPLLSAQKSPRTSMGVVQYSFSSSPHTRSAYEFLEYCHSLGAGGIQIGLDSLDSDYLDQVRRRAAELGMYLEAIVSLPENETIDFQRQVVAARRAGALCLRSACLNGRRYESFTSLDQWKSFVASSHRRIARAVPVLEKHRMPLGIENHKDWTADEMVHLMERHSSEFLGACLDTGNNISLLDEPMEAVSKLAPFAITTHFKNMAVKDDPEGFLLSEVPLDRGLLDLAKVLDTIRTARPRVRFNLEMITRDPLKVPCLTDPYWVTFPERDGIYLARTLRLVRDHPPAGPLPHVSGIDQKGRRRQEEENVRQCLEFARDKLGLRMA
jgi:3-oxoisoapionate decarboxylase